MTENDFSNVDLLVLDVDGVLTDGRIMLTGDGDEIKAFHVRDESGMKYWKRVGKKLAIITGRGSPAVTRRAKELNADALRMNVKDKLPVLQELLLELDVPADRAAFMGDDLTDMPSMRHCRLAAAPSDASAEVLEIVQHVTDRPGGMGCVREFIEVLLKSAGLWDQIMARYVGDRPDGSEDAE